MTNKLCPPDILGLILAMLCGAIIAVGNRAEWQAPVENAQVLAKLVIYPIDTPFYIYQIKVWSLLNQIAAALLYSGVSETVTSLCIQASVGAVSFAGIFFITHAVCSKLLISILMPLFMYSLSLVGTHVAYPIALLGTDSSYGIFGLSFTLLVIGLLANGHYKTGALCAGLAPAFHPGLGTFCAIIASITVILNRRDLKPDLPELLRYFMLGTALTLGSLVWQYLQCQHLPELAPAVKQQYLDAFIRTIDYHRTAGGWAQTGVMFGLLMAVLASVSLRSENIPQGAGIVYSSIIASVAATIAMVLAAITIPQLSFLNLIIPWRFMNYANLCLLPVSCGILAADFPRSPRLRSLLLTILLASCIAIRMLELPAESILYFIVLLTMLGVITLRIPDLPQKPFAAVRKVQWVLIAALLTLFLFRQIIPGMARLARQEINLPHRNNSEILNLTSKRPGILLTAGGMHLFQLVTRRPVLLDGYALDQFPYIAETGPQFHAILKTVYGIDMFASPPPEALNKASITYSHKALWEQRSCQEWQHIKTLFGVTDIMTPITWELRLPIVAKQPGRSDIMTPFHWNLTPPVETQNSGMALYTIPDENVFLCQ